MRPGTRPGVAVAAALLLTSGCAGEPEPSDPLTRVGTRSYQSVTWDTVFLVGGTVDDSLLFMPRLLAGRGDLLYAFDYGDQQLKAFGSDGELRWRHGGAGSGPGEFRNPLDLEVDPNGDVWVFDGGTGRLTAFSADGEMLRTVSPGLAIRDVVKVRDRLFVLPVMEGDEYWVQLAMDGSRVGSGGFPTTELADAAPMVRQTLAVSGTGELWASVFPFGNTFLVYDGDELRCVGQLIEGEPFPEAPSPDMSVWAVDAALDDESLFVLPRGNTDDALAIVDEYSIEDCSYTRTLPLPRRVRALTGGGETFFLAFEDPAPAILALRLAAPSR
jgi:hypothetical protein